MSASQDRLNAKKKRLTAQEEEKTTAQKTTTVAKKLQVPQLSATTAKTATTATPTAKKYTPVNTGVQINALGAGSYGADKSITKKLQVPQLNKTTAAAKTTAAVEGANKIKAFGAGDYSGGGRLLTKAAQSAAAGALGTASGLTEIAAQATPTGGEQSLGQFSGFGDLGRALRESKQTGESINTITKRIEQQRSRKRKADQAKAYGVADSLSQRSGELTEQAKEGAGKVGSFLVDLGVTGTQMVGDALANAVLPGSGLAAMATRVYGSSSGEARREGKSEEQQALTGLKSAAIAWGTERLSGGLAKVYGKGTADEIVEKIADKLTKTDTGKRAVTWLINSGGEGIEEVLEDVLNPLADRVLGLDGGEGAIFTTDDAAQMGYDFLLGAAMGAIGGAGQLKAPQITRAENVKTGAGQTEGSAVTAGRLNNENGLAAYTPQERINLSGGAKNRIVTTYQEALEFVKNALSNKNNVDRAYMGIVPDSTARKVANETGINISGYGATLHSDNVRHIVKNHGDSRTETLRGQMGVAAEDIAHIPKILAAPDKVYLSEKPDSRGRRVLVFEKTIGDNLVTMQAVSDGTHSLQTDTLYKQKKKNPQGTEYYNVGKSADPAHNVRNVPPQGSSMSIIPQLGQNVKAPQIVRKTPTLQMPTLEKGVVRSTTVTEGAGLARNDYSRALADTDTATAATLNDVGKALGVQIELVDSVKGGAANGEYDRGSGVIRIAADAENPIQTVAVHELTHHLQVMAPAEYETYRGAAVSWYVDQYGVDGLTALTERYRKLGQENGVAMDEEGALDEVAADFTEKLLDDADLFGHLTQESPTVAQKLLDALREFIARVRTTLTGKSRDAASQSAYGRSFNELEQIARKWQAAYAAAAKQAKAAENTNTAAETGSGVRYQIKQLANGMKYVQADRQVIFGNDPAAWSEQLENYINGKVRRGENVQLIAEDGDVLTLTAKSAGKLSSMYDNSGRTLSNEVFERKANAAAHIDELAQVSRRGNRTVLDEGNRHGSMAENGWNYRTAYFRDFDGAYYRVKISVAQGANGNMVYNIGDMQERSAPQIDGSSGKSGALGGNASQKSAMSGGADVSTAIPTIRPNGENVNRKFSLKTTPAVDSTGRELSPQQREYFKDSKVRDAEGRLKKLYHQTEGGFTVFDPNSAGAGRSDGETPFGIFLKSSSRDIGLRGKTQMELYANITNPLYAENREDLSWKMELLSPEYARIKQEHRALDAEYGAKVEAAKQEWVSFITEWRKSNPNASRSALYDVPEFNRLFDAEDSIIQEWTERADALSTQAKETITAAMRKAGYDGVILKNDKGSFGRSTDAFIALDPAQVKNVDNIAPTGNADIRYSLKGSKDREVLSIKQQIAGASEQLNRTEPVAVKNVTPLLGRMSIKQKRAWAEQEALKYGGRIDRQGYGSIEVSRKDINSALNYLQDDGEIAAFSTLPAVLKRGREVYREDDHKGRGYSTVTFAAPVVINNVRGNMAAVVRETSKNHYDMHRIVMPDGSAFTFNEKVNAETGPTAATPNNDALTQPTGSASVPTIRSNGGDVNKKFSLKGTQDYEQELAELKRERTRLASRNKVLEQRVQELRSEMRVSKEPIAVASDVKRLGSEIIQKYRSKAKYSDIQAPLEAMANTVLRQDASMADMLPYATEAAEIIVDNATELTETGAELLDIKNYLQQQKIMFNGDMDDYNAFRRAHMGTLKLSKAEGLPVDTAYAEMTELFGEGYFPSNMYTEANKLRRIGEVLDGMESIYENPYAGYRDAAIQEVAYELIDGAFERVGPRVTFADRKAAEQRQAQETIERLTKQLQQEQSDRQWEEKRAGSLMRQASSLYEEIQRLKGGTPRERPKPQVPQIVKTPEQELRENGERNRNAYWQTPPESVPVTREESAQRMAEERARRARIEEERKAIPKTLETVGVAPFGSEADYAGAETLAQQAGDNERARRRMKKEMAKVPATEKERLLARQVAGGQLTMKDIPNTVDRETVARLADYYIVMDNSTESELLRQKRNIILEREEAKMPSLLGEGVDYDEGGLSESGKPSGKVKRTFSTLRRNLQIPARICATEWGAEHGRQVYETLFYPVTENNGRQVDWVNSMMDRVRTFTDSTGKQRELTRDERAVVQWQVEKHGIEEKVKSLSKQYAPAAENVKNGAAVGDAAREFGITKKMPEYEILEQYAAYLSAKKNMEGMKVDAAMVDAAAAEYSKLYNELYEAINTFLAAHGYKPIGFIEGYAPHMQPEEAKTGFSKAMKLLGLDDTAMMLPTSISGQTADLKPYKQYDPFFQTRYGDKTEYDIAKGFESYVYYLGNIFYHTDDIMRLRTAARYIRKTYSSEEASEQIEWAEGARDTFSNAQIEDFLKMNGIIGKDSQLSEQDAKVKLNEYTDELYEQIGDVTRYSEMVKYLDNYANRLAGKQNMADRGAEAATGRGSLNWINSLTGKFGGAKLAFNVSSALNQTSQLPMVAVENGEANTVKAIGDFFKREQAEAFANSSNFLKGKKGVQWLVGAETNWEKFKEKGFTMTEAVDSLTAFTAVRSKYLKEIKAGKSHAEAMKAADEYGRNVMGSRARGEKPMLFDTKNPFWQIVTRFQLEAMNSWEHISRDVPKEIQQIAKTEGKTKAAKTLAWRAGRYTLYAFLANWGIGMLSGGSPVPYDVLGTIMEAVGAATGVTKNEAIKRLLDDVLEALFDERLFGTDEPEDDEEADVWAALESLFGNVANDVPIVGRVAALAGIGDQTLPVTDLSKLVDFGKSVKNNGLFSTETLDKGLTAGGEFVFGGNQLRKTVQGDLAVARGGVYDSKGRLKYEVAQTPLKAAQGVLFGRSALKESQDYYAGSDTAGKFSAAASSLTAAKNEGDETAEVVSRWWNKQQSKLTEINKAIRQTSDRQERKALESQAASVRENALATKSTYTAAVEKYLQRGLGTDEAYREANRECFGAEYALEAYSKDVYQRARNAVQNRRAWNVSYDDFYEYYFGTKDIEATDYATAAAQKLNWLYNSGMSKTAQAELWLTDMASDSAAQAQEELENSAGITLEQYYTYKLLSANDTKKAEKLNAINALDLTVEQKNALYLSEGWAESTLGEAPWYTGSEMRVPTIVKKQTVPTIVRKTAARETAPIIVKKSAAQTAPTIVRKTATRETAPTIVKKGGSAPTIRRIG